VRGRDGEGAIDKARDHQLSAFERLSICASCCKLRAEFLSKGAEIATGRQGDPPKPLNDRREAIIARLAELEAVPKKIGHDLAYYEKEEQQPFVKIAANAEAFELEVLRILTTEIKASFAEVERFIAALATIEGGRDFLLRRAEFFAAQRRQNLHNAHLGPVNETLARVTFESLLPPDAVARSARAWSDRSEALHS